MFCDELIDRRAACDGLVIVSCGALLCLGSIHRTHADDSQRIAWLKAHAAELRSIDPADADFADLEPFRRAIGDLLLGIYKIEGELLTLCVARAGELRPT